nr:MAG TPA: hypothetical protein [Caudoviricetes sp.]
MVNNRGQPRGKAFLSLVPLWLTTPQFYINYCFRLFVCI